MMNAKQELIAMVPMTALPFVDCEPSWEHVWNHITRRMQ